MRPVTSVCAASGHPIGSTTTMPPATAVRCRATGVGDAVVDAEPHQRRQDELSQGIQRHQHKPINNPRRTPRNTGGEAERRVGPPRCGIVDLRHIASPAARPPSPAAPATAASPP